MRPDPENLLRRKALEDIVARKRTQSSVAEEFNVSRQAVSQWVRRFKEEGRIAGEYERKKKPLIAREDKDALRDIVMTKKPSDFDIESDDDRWHWVEFQDLVAQEHKRRLPPKTCREFLTEWGITDIEISKERAAKVRKARKAQSFRPISQAESQELRVMLEAARLRAESEQVALEREQRAGQNAERAKAKAKAKAAQRQKNKQARKAKKKQRKKR